MHPSEDLHFHREVLAVHGVQVDLRADFQVVEGTLAVAVLQVDGNSVLCT